MTAALESVSVYRELESELTGPQGPFALTTLDVAGESMRVYRETPGSLDDVLRGLTDAYADSVLVVEEDVEYTYGDVAELADRLAGALDTEYRIEAGQRVGVIMRNQLAFVVSLMAIARRGAVAVLFNSRESRGQIGAAVADASCVVVIADGARAALVRESDVLADLIVAGGELPAGPARDYADLIATGSASPEPAAVTADSPCLILFTSGTSGRSKGVVLTQRNVCTMIMNLRLIKEMNIAVNARKYGMEADALRDLMPKLSALLIFPLFHTSGLVSLLTTMTSGGFVVILRRWDPTAAIEMISRHKLAMLAGPPMVIADLLSVNPPPEAVASLVNISPAGQATPPDLVAKIGAVLPSAGRSVGWGMTEATGSICTAGGDLLAAHPDSSGPVSPVMDVRVVDPAGSVAPPGAIGELQARGPLIMAGYLDRPEETAAVFDGSWYRTGDLGYLDDNGLVFVVDRKKDIVISAGENIYCAEVEYALMASGLFAEVAVFGVPHERLGETVVAVVNTHDGREMAVAQVQDIVRETLAEYKIPTDVVFDLGPLPRNATGKILKRKVREAYSG
ncbi:class I adenylate-forming enzyme family protein [Gordonia rubripertincta]|jgi:acyl-CoA synthetase (AMP-forming)/AMP-acid ligase II|uniref:Class I adenylate-forming enzyme family protein n=1 Tax=Gordonia rubripertincta TaxID=36822 RepID=A0ABT4MXA5_GORRU|nr:class I adenylate-forming enzyme family protein [Gordonia rubripertincta]MCZ4551637.1 class I adenylate-forming enzyme family protein [Gordonia rubripertincta]